MNRTTRGVWALTLIMALALLAVTLNLNPAHASPDSTLYFNDFTGTGPPNDWYTLQNPLDAQPGTILTQQGQGTWSLGLIGGASLGYLKAIANQTDPIIGPNTKDGQTIFMTWKVQPMNLTSNSLLQETVEVHFGLRNCQLPASNVCYENKIGWKIAETTIKSLNKATGGASSLNQKEALYFTIAQPNHTAKYCFDGTTTIAIAPPVCGANQNSTTTAIAYGDVLHNPVDLTQVHIFTMLARFYPVTQQSWIAFNMDSLAWQNITQTSCQCIDGPTGSYYNMWPFYQFYRDGSRLDTGGFVAISAASFIDYVQVLDYQPVTVPTGQLIGCFCPKPTNNNALTSQQPFDNLFQAEAYSIGGGNSAFGGIVITIFLLFFFILLPSMAVYKATGHAPPGFILDFVMIAVVFLDYFVGILPIWITLISIILLASIGFGLVKSQFMVET